MEDFARGMTKVMAGINGDDSVYSMLVVFTVGAIATHLVLTAWKEHQIGILAAMALFNMTFLIFFRAMALLITIGSMRRGALE